MTVLYEENPGMFIAQPGAYLFSLASIFYIGPTIAINHQIPFVGIGLGEELSGWVGGLIVFFALFQMFGYWLHSVSNTLTVTPREFIWRHGILSKQTRRVDMASIRTGEVFQSPLQRLFNAGNVTIWSAGDRPEFWINGMPYGNELNQLISTRGDVDNL